MAFHHTMKFGIMGALLALAAVPGIAQATPTMYTNFSSWDSAVTSSVKEYTTICTTQYAPPTCATPVSDLTNVPSVPLKGGVSLNVVSPPLKKNIVGTDWNSFWPNELTSTSTAYTGDILVSKASQSGVPITSIALTLSSPLNEFGFVALPQDTANPYDLTVTLLDVNGNFITSEDAIIGPGATCSQGTIVGDPTGSPSPCGFFGYTGGQSVAGIDLSITNSACDTNLPRISGVVKNAVTPVACNGGMGVGDFVVGAVTPTPEPASMAILGAGLLGLGAIRRRLKS